MTESLSLVGSPTVMLRISVSFPALTAVGVIPMTKTYRTMPNRNTRPMYMRNSLYLTVWHDIDSDCTKTKLTESQLLGLSWFLVAPLPGGTIFRPRTELAGTVGAWRFDDGEASHGTLIRPANNARSLTRDEPAPLYFLY